MKQRVCDCCGRPIREDILSLIRYRYELRRCLLSIGLFDTPLDLCEKCYKRIKDECEKEYFYQEEK